MHLRACDRPVLTEASRGLLSAAAVLSMLGVVMVVSTTAPTLARASGFGAAYLPLLSQLGKVSVSLVALGLGFLVPPSLWLRHRRALAVAAWLATAAVFLPGLGVEQNGARRWLHLGIGFQPVELARVALVIWIAGHLGSVGRDVVRFRRGPLPVIGVTCAFVVVLLPQPDFGSALFVLMLAGVLLLLGGVRVGHLAVTVAAALPPMLVFAVTRLDHVRARLAAYLDPNMGYQARQSLTALGAGGLFGKGLGAGFVKLGYLPMVSNDFVLAAVGEELGFLGTSVVLFLFLVVLWSGVTIARRQQDPARFLLASGLLCSLVVPALLNVAVVTAAVPTKGIALPFVSAGGTSLAASLFSVGLLVRLGARERGEEGKDG